ncbi:ceramide phosphoethanolamine synthase-like isoform X2 [Eupeodes corollae]|uniref:ceramide phosphoethanolamine synthase-like isoform X2 n=1 Tax=Eupeodes corollae TaxID=290404 RepID=UPI002492F127|nr:ceramide phosphoethanolamine synthase-like isoform X2 [Eupeodes corollae]
MLGPSSQISKILLTLLFLLIIFYIFMDVQLYLRIQNYPIERNYHFNVSVSYSPQIDAVEVGYPHKNAGKPSTLPLQRDQTVSPVTSSDVLSKSTNAKYQAAPGTYEASTWLSCEINPLCHVTVKAILLDHTNHYIFAPLATIFDDIIGFSRSSFITANMISFFHVFVACLAGKLVSSDSLGYRRMGVVLFQFRTFLDDLDGHVARVKKNIRGERSEVGTSGYYIDGLCDGLGCIALLIGICFFLKNNPPRRGYSQLQAILPLSESKSAETGVIYKVKTTTKKVARKVFCFAGQLLLSSTAWNRYIFVYQDMLERNDVLPIQFNRQNLTFKSNWFFSVAWIWRVVNVHSMLHCVLLSIFCDKLWDFLKMVQYSGYIILLVAICATEMHVLEAHTFIFSSLTGNNTSL